MPFEFSLNVEFIKFTEKPVNLLGKRQRCYHRANKMQVSEKILKLSPVNASLIHQIL